MSSVTIEKTNQTGQQKSATSYWASLGAEVELGKNWYVGGKLVYLSYSPADSFTMTVDGVTSTYSGQRTVILPQFVLSWRKF